MEEKALELWRRWFEFSGEPWEEDTEWADITCFFCGEESPTHADDCVFVAAKKLVEESKPSNG